MTGLKFAAGAIYTSLLRGSVGGISLLLAACGGGGGEGTAPPAVPLSPAPPKVIATSSIASGVAPLIVNFDASKSTDPQGFPLTFAWTFSDGTNATGSTPRHTFQNHGTFTATAIVDDGQNTTTSTPITITVNPAAPSVPAAVLSLKIMGVAPSAASVTIVANDQESLPLTYSIQTPPAIGTATINANSGVLTYSVSGYASSESDIVVVNVANLGASATVSVPVALHTDPLLPTQWHIQNVGQNSFASSLPTAGNDMDIAGAWTAGFSGKGIKIGIVDSGMEAAHEDLAANVDLSHSMNFLTGTNDPTPSLAGFDHGTAVAGIIGAVAFNGKGGRGVAYNATLRGYNFIAPGAQTDANLAASFGGVAASADTDVFNASFGVPSTSLQTQSMVSVQADIQSTTLRNGLGAPLVYAAGNGFQDIAGANDPLCAYSRSLGVSCGDPAGELHNQDSIPIVVGALNAAGIHSSYSNTGSSLWISAPGGEYGFNTTFSGISSAIDTAPAIITTAHTGCGNVEYGPPTYPNGANALDSLGANPQAMNCQYTAQMNGTSAAAPNVTGVIALMLEANPSLSYRDVKHILAKTAKRVDPTFAGVSAPIFNATSVVLEQGWTMNAAGNWFSNRYGFGGVDASAAVSAAKSITSHIPALQFSSNYQNVASGTGYVLATGYPVQFNVQESFSSVEQVLLSINEWRLV